MAQAVLIKQNAAFTISNYDAVMSDFMKFIKGCVDSASEFSAQYDSIQVIGSKPVGLTKYTPVSDPSPDSGILSRTASFKISGAEEFGTHALFFDCYRSKNPSTEVSCIRLWADVCLERGKNRFNLANNAAIHQWYYQYRWYLTNEMKHQLWVIDEDGILVVGDDGVGGLNPPTRYGGTRGHCFFNFMAVEQKAMQVGRHPEQSSVRPAWCCPFYNISPVQDPTDAQNQATVASRVNGILSTYIFANYIPIPGDINSKKGVNALLDQTIIHFRLGSIPTYTMFGYMYKDLAGALSQKQGDPWDVAWPVYGTIKKADGSPAEILGSIMWDIYHDQYDLKCRNGNIQYLYSHAAPSKGIPFTVQNISGEDVILLPWRQLETAASRSKGFMAVKLS